MPIETRTILFDAAEMAQAAYAYCIRQDLALPAGRLKSVVAEPEASDAVKLLFEGGGQVVLSYSAMAAGLIMHCAAAGVPLPRHARKRLTPAGEGMALIIRMPEYAGEAEDLEPAQIAALPAA